MPYIGKSPSFGVRNRFVYVASSGDTSVSGADANGATLTFTDGAYVDVYLNGKLTRSCVLQNPPTLGPDDREMKLTSDDGFSGYISRVQISNRSMTPEGVYQLYLKGPYSGSCWAKTSAIKSEDPELECSKS